MESINYKKIFTQKVQHQEFIHKLDEFMEHHNDEVEDQDEQIMGILKYLTEWLVNHILHVAVSYTHLTLPTKRIV